VKSPVFETVEVRTEPKILVSVDTSLGGLITDSERMQISGTAVDKAGLRDLYIFVNEQKVFFEAAREAGAPIKFAADVPLKPGNNAIVIVAREDQDFTARRVLVVHRRGTEIAKAVKVPTKQGADKGLDKHQSVLPEAGVLPAPAVNP